MRGRRASTTVSLLLLGAISWGVGCGAASRGGPAGAAAPVEEGRASGPAVAEAAPTLAAVGGPCAAVELPAEWRVERLDDLSVRDPSDVLAVADSRAIVRWDGARWEREYDVGDVVHLIDDVCVPPTGGAIAVGQLGLVLRHDGTVWSRTEIPVRDNLFAVWQGEPGRAIAVTSSGQAYRLEGERWDLLGDTGTRQALFAVWGAAADDVFAVGEGGTILHFDGSSWSPQPSPTTELLAGLWGFGPRAIFAVGRAGVVLRFDGAEWTLQPTGAEEFVLVDVWGSGPSDVWAVGRTPDPDEELLLAPPEDPRGVLLHYDGASWRRPDFELDLLPTSVAGHGDRDLYLAAADGRLLRCDARRLASSPR